MTVFYLCILDFEATCDENMTNNDKEQMEIIEFPSVLVKVNDHKKCVKIEFISEYSKYVKPTIHPILSDFCTKLTGIKQETVENADIIDIVYNEHKQWLAKHVPVNQKVIIATCGNWDLATQLPREIRNKKLT